MEETTNIQRIAHFSTVSVIWKLRFSARAPRKSLGSLLKHPRLTRPRVVRGRGTDARRPVSVRLQRA